MNRDSNSATLARRDRLAAARAKLDATSAQRPFTRQSDRTHFPLSSSQQRLWFLEQVIPGSLVYQVPAVVHVRGELNITAMESALRKVIDRHDVLRSRIEQQGPEAVSIIEPSIDFELERKSLTSESEESAIAAGVKAANEFIRIPFDLEQGPLIRAQLTDLGENEWLLTFVLHHIICEAWSISILFEELEQFYLEECGAGTSRLTELPIQFGDYAAWERQSLNDPEARQSIEFWKEKLAEVVPIDLPTDRPRPPTQTQNGDILDHTIGHSDVQKIERFAAEHGVTPFVLTLSALFSLIYRLTEEESLAIGCPVSSREHEEIQGLIGFFVNTVVMTGGLDDDMTTSDLLRSVKATVLDAFSHQSAPFESIVDELDIPRDLSRNPVFQLMFAFQNTPLPDLKLHGLESARVLSPKEVHSGTSKVDVSVIVEPAKDHWIVWAEYNSDLFNQSTIQNMLENYHALLMAMIEHPAEPVSRLSYISEETLHKVLVEWNDTKRPPNPLSIVKRFAVSVQKYGERVAVSNGADSISYAELDSFSNALAAELTDEAVNPGDVVAVFFPRSIEVVAAELAILKLGATYVPIDPNYPDDRIQFMLSDSGAKLCLTYSELVDRIGDFQSKTIRTVDYAASNTEFVAAEASPESLAYIVYTSGSTGKPKGVEVHHEALQNFVDWQCDYHELTPDDVFAMLVSPAFDGSIWEIWPSLSSGASLAVVDDATRIQPDKLVEWIANEGVTSGFLPTLLGEAVLAQKWPENHSMRSILTGGEALHPVTEEHLPCRLFNHYGPTENTVITTVCEVVPGSDTMPPIGRPIPNVEAYILDRHLQPVPPGAVGELCLSGLSVAQGYRNRPDLTEEVFVENPVEQSQYRRMYRTGDLCRFDMNGSIHFIGRRDRQVKIRGFRVELGEIESVLLAQSGVSECTVIVRSDSHTGQDVLIAYVVPTKGVGIQMGELRKALNTSLPQFMVPQLFVELDELPRTKNGKIDRQALPDASGQGARARTTEPPSTDAERLLAEVWSDVLGVENVSLSDNFFDLGGNSLLAIEVVHKIRESTGLRINPLVLFSGNLGQTAAEIDIPQSTTSRQAEPKAAPGSSLLARLRRLIGISRN